MVKYFIHPILAVLHFCAITFTILVLVVVDGFYLMWDFNHRQLVTKDFLSIQPYSYNEYIGNGMDMTTIVYKTYFHYIVKIWKE